MTQSNYSLNNLRIILNSYKYSDETVDELIERALEDKNITRELLNSINPAVSYWHLAKILRSPEFVIGM